jgi:hypothetical protein
MSEKTITVEWEFNIGDVVTLKEGVEAFYFSDQLSGFPERKPNVFEITERITQECHGGLQKFYQMGFVHPPLRVPHYSVVSTEEALKTIKEYKDKKSAKEQDLRDAMIREKQASKVKNDL